MQDQPSPADITYKLFQDIIEPVIDTFMEEYKFDHFSRYELNQSLKLAMEDHELGEPLTNEEILSSFSTAGIQAVRGSGNNFNLKNSYLSHDKYGNSHRDFDSMNDFLEKAGINPDEVSGYKDTELRQGLVVFQRHIRAHIQDQQTIQLDNQPVREAVPDSIPEYKPH